MPIFRRPDGKLATDVPAARQIMPFIMRTRNESTVYFEQEIDLTRTAGALTLLKDRLEDPAGTPVALLEAVR